MDISIYKRDVITSVEEEISRVASGAYAEDGSSLYDGLRYVSRDSAVMNILIDEALTVMLSALHRFTNTHVNSSGMTISFEIAMSERRARAKIDIVPPLIISTLAKIIISKYFSEKQQEKLAAHFDSLAAADMQTLQKNLFEKAAPVFKKITEDEDSNDNNL